MTKYDIRLRRKSLTSGQIGRHKDFKNLYRNETNVSKEEGRSKVIAIVIGVIIISGMIILGLLRINKTDQPKNNKQPIENNSSKIK